MVISLLESSTVTAITSSNAFYFHANGSSTIVSSGLQFHDGNIVPAFNPLLLNSENQLATLNDRIIFTFEVTCRMSCLSQLLCPLIRILVNSSNSSSQNVAGSWFLKLADPRVIHDEILSCNQIISSQIAPVIGDTSITFDAQQIIDSYGLIDIPKTNDSGCTSGLSRLLADRSRPFSTYTASITSSPLITTGNCEAIKDAQQKCEVSIILQLGSRILRTTETVPRMSRVEIWLDIGAIVGGVQFFAWIFNGR